MNPKYGLYYADDFTKLVSSTNSWTKIAGLANSNFWDVATHDSFFKMQDNVCN